MLQTTINTILRLDDYRPSDDVNELFTRLVDLVLNAPESTTWDELTVARMQAAASASESEMELHWANRIAASAQPEKTLHTFPYIGNYKKLVEREVALVRETDVALSSASRVLMVGSGPLPLTTYQMIVMTDAQVDHIDVSHEALQISERVMLQLGYAVKSIHADGALATLAVDQYDVILIAGLAGQNLTEKQAIIDNILPSLKSTGRIIVRSARGPRALLYPAILARSIRRVALLREYHPDDDIINSVFIYKKELPHEA